MTRTAHCCCGALRVEVSADPDAVVACHCGECQRRTGSVFGVGAYFKREHVHAEGPSKIYIRDGQEGRKLRQHFCPTCGTTVFWDADLRPDHIGVAVVLSVTATSPGLRDRFGRSQSTSGLRSPTISRTSRKGGRPNRSAVPVGPRTGSDRLLTAGKK
jgi:hypothetical protein